jgi:C4-dicarboxylate-specific signal transduction histidine kinase
MDELHNEKILVIDDNSVNNQLVATFLLPCGYTIQVAEDGEDGICKAQAAPPDLILLDVMTPGMSGYEVYRVIRDNPVTADIPVLFIIADDSVDSHQDAFSSGGNDFIAKPICEMVLRTRVANLINLSKTRRELERLNRYHVVSEKLSRTGHWTFTQFANRSGVCRCSAQFRKIMALDEKDAENFSVADFRNLLNCDAVDRRSVAARWNEAQRMGGIFKELAACRINGEKKILRVWVEFIREENYFKVFGSVQDVTELMMMLYEEMSLESKLAVDERYSAMVESTMQLAHKLNQPLASIALNVNTITLFVRHGNFEQQELFEIARDVEDEVMRAKSVVERMRSVVSRRPLQLESFNLQDLVRRTLQLFKRESLAMSITFVQRGFDRLTDVYMDRDGLQQVLVALIKNACESLQEHPVPQPEVLLYSRLDDDQINIYIADNGAGISSAIADRLFTPFATTKPDKLGLGLVVCKSIVKRLGGSLENLPRRRKCGTTFRIVLPLEYKNV